MTLRKFGTPEQVLPDEKDSQGVRKQASEKFTDKDREELRRENSNWEGEGGK